MDILAPKATAMKNERQRLTVELQQAEAASKPKDLNAEVNAIVNRIWRLGDELMKAQPERLRELFKLIVDRIALRFDHVQRGKRLECPLASGVIHLRPDSPISSSVNRGNWTPVELFSDGVKVLEPTLQQALMAAVA